MEFVEVIEQFKRMCRNNNCDSCPMKSDSIEFSFCRFKICENPQKYQNIIMDWARRHPEPQYSSWGEWLKNIGIGNFIRYNNNGEIVGFNLSFDKLNEPIPVSMAQKLGLEPINNV